MEIGKQGQDLIFQGNPKIKWGDKFVDLLDNNGNLKVSSLFQTVSNEDEIVDTGIYLLDDDSVILCIDDRKVKLR